MEGRFHSRDQTHSECSNNLVEILPQIQKKIQGFLLLVSTLPLNSSEDQKKKDFHRNLVVSSAGI